MIPKATFKKKAIPKASLKAKPNGKHTPIRILHGDCLEVLATLQENSIDACVTDPPYHLQSVVKRFGAPNAAPAQFGTDGAYARMSKGFMNKQWDGGDVAFRPETWAAVLRVLKPGGYMLCFASTRGYHRMVCAIEDAGFIIHPMLGWIFGSGFPKATNLSKQLDKAAGAVREVVSHLSSDGVQRAPRETQPGGGNRKDTYVPTQTAPVTPEAKQWDGWGYGLQSLKPALEPICMAQKPAIREGMVANVLKYGTGAINVSACRVGTEAVSIHGYKGNSFSQSYKEAGTSPELDEYRTVAGRWPSNILHDGSPEVEAAFAAFGSSKSPPVGSMGGGSNKHSVYNGGWAGQRHSNGYGDTGTASRFFFRAKPDVCCGICGLLCDDGHAKTEVCDAHNVTNRSSVADAAFAPLDVAGYSPLGYVGSSQKATLSVPNVAGSSEPCPLPTLNTVLLNVEAWPLAKIVQNVKSAATLCDSCATAIAHALVVAKHHQNVESHLTPASMDACTRHILCRNLALYVEGRENTDTILTTESLSILFGSVFHAIAESTRQVNAESSVNIERDQLRLQYSSKASKSDRAGSKHPTVKPISLICYLCRLITPPNGTILDPFAGSGTTGEAAFREGFNALLIEQDQQSIADSKWRSRVVQGVTAPWWGYEE